MRRFTTTAVLLVLVASGCGSDDTASNAGSTTATTAPPSSSPAETTVRLATTNLGEILVDGNGRTIYLFTPDTATKVACTGDCATTWPPLEGVATANGIDAGELGTVTRDDGSVQPTFHGHPLYRFAADAKAGDLNGQGIGSKWYVIDRSGNPVTAEAPGGSARSGSSTTTAPSTAPTTRDGY